MADYDLLDKSFDISKRKLRALEKLDKDLIKDTTVKMPMALSRIWDSVLLDSSSVKEDMAREKTWLWSGIAIGLCIGVIIGGFIVSILMTI